MPYGETGMGKQARRGDLSPRAVTFKQGNRGLSHACSDLNRRADLSRCTGRLKACKLRSNSAAAPAPSSSMAKRMCSR